MKLPTTPPPTTKIGSCPHGLPPGACPICGAGGGGGAKKADFSAKAGEMSWSDCAAIGNMMKAQKFAKVQNEQSIQSQLLAATVFEKNMANLAQKIANFAQNIQASVPAIIAKPVAFIANNILVPILNVIKDIPLNIQNTLIKIGEKLADISDKLSAIFGELKNSIEKKISDKFKDLKKKITSLFAIFDVQEDEDEEKQIEEAQKIFREKTQLHSLTQKTKGSDNDEN